MRTLSSLRLYFCERSDTRATLVRELHQNLGSREIFLLGAINDYARRVKNVQSLQDAIKAVWSDVTTNTEQCSSDFTAYWTRGRTKRKNVATQENVEIRVVKGHVSNPSCTQVLGQTGLDSLVAKSKIRRDQAKGLWSPNTLVFTWIRIRVEVSKCAGQPIEEVAEWWRFDDRVGSEWDRSGIGVGSDGTRWDQIEIERYWH